MAAVNGLEISNHIARKVGLNEYFEALKTQPTEPFTLENSDAAPTN